MSIINSNITCGGWLQVTVCLDYGHYIFGFRPLYFWISALIFLDFGPYILGFRPLYFWISASIFSDFGHYIFGFRPLYFQISVNIFSDLGLKYHLILSSITLRVSYYLTRSISSLRFAIELGNLKVTTVGASCAGPTARTITRNI